MAYYKITETKKHGLTAKIQAYGKDVVTGETKLYVKRIYNTEKLTEAKFRKYVERAASDFELQLQEAEEQAVETRVRILTFAELAEEWLNTVKATLSVHYYERSADCIKRFNDFLQDRGLFDKPISFINVRDVQQFLNTYALHSYNVPQTVRLKKDMPASVNFRELARMKVINRCTSYNMRVKGANIAIDTAKAICEACGLDFKEYFELTSTERRYSAETVKGFRRMLRTIFNEAIRYEWITKNPVCATKIMSGSNNTALRPVPEKEVFSLREARYFLQKLDELGWDDINKKIPLKMMLLTGVRNAEMCGLKWCDIDFANGLVHIRRNRMYSPTFGMYKKEPKTRTSKRDIPLTEELMADLKTYMEWFREADDEFDTKLDKYYLAVNAMREPVFPRVLLTWLTKYEQMWGLKNVSCHGLRHTYCSLLLSMNVPIQTVSKYMGHSDSTVTLKVYSHFLPDTQAKVVSALNKISNKEGDDD